MPSTSTDPDPTCINVNAEGGTCNHYWSEHSDTNESSQTVVARGVYDISRAVGDALTEFVGTVQKSVKDEAAPAGQRLLFPTGIDLIDFHLQVGSIGSAHIVIAGVGRQVNPKSLVEALQSLELGDPQAIVNACEAEWDANKADCSAFARAVASDLGVTLTGDANSICDQITGDGWNQLADGPAAKAAADSGQFVVAALRGSENVPAQAHGHVTIIVTGDLAKGKYPTGYWGRLGGVGMKNTTINYAWNSDSVDLVHYASKST